MDKNNVTYDKAYKFALRIVNAYKYLIEEKKEFTLSKQLLKKTIRSFTAKEIKFGSDARAMIL